MAGFRSVLAALLLCLACTAATYQDKMEEQKRIIRPLAQECHQAMANSTAQLEDCPVMWDGFMCWPATPPGLVRFLPCPAYIMGFNPHRNASKHCTVEGGWFVRTSTNTTWTNYSQCYTERVTNDITQFPHIENASLIAHYVPIVKAVSHVGYGVSLATLLVAFCVFATFKRLRCPRNKLHMHLFVSFMLRAFATLLKDSLFVGGTGLPSDFTVQDGELTFAHGHQFGWQCKLMVSIWQYFLMANYSWILMEGLYLHNLIFFSVFSETSSIALYVILGWGLPLLFVGPWVFVRALLEDTFCWTTNENPLYFQLIKGPTAISILVNFILFINTVRVLRSKLKASKSEEKRRRWGKSTLVLVPLFGVHYAMFLTMSYLGVEGRLELTWLFIDQLFASFQGFFVAVIYSLLNAEVRQELKSYLGSVFSCRRRRYQPHGNGCKRGSTITETCLSTLAPNVQADFNTTSFVGPNSLPRKSVVSDNLDVYNVDISDTESLQLACNELLSCCTSCSAWEE